MRYTIRFRILMEMKDGKALFMIQERSFLKWKTIEGLNSSNIVNAYAAISFYAHIAWLAVDRVDFKC